MWRRAGVRLIGAYQERETIVETAPRAPPADCKSTGLGLSASTAARRDEGGALGQPHCVTRHALQCISKGRRYGIDNHTDDAPAHTQRSTHAHRGTRTHTAPKHTLFSQEVARRGVAAHGAHHGSCRSGWPLERDGRRRGGGGGIGAGTAGTGS